jgi:hypothetical protein
MTRQLSDGDDSGTILGQSTTDLVGFHGTAPTSQPAGAASVTATPVAATAAAFGFSTSAKLENFISLVDKMRTCLVNNGLMAAS